MGANLARNICRRGTPTAVHNRTTAKMTEFMAEFGDEGPFTGCETVEDFVTMILPRLRERGLHQPATAPTTLRSRIGGTDRLVPSHPAARHRWADLETIG